MRVTLVLLLVSRLLCLTVISFAQDTNVVDAQENLLKIGGADATYGVVRGFDNRYEGVEGSPFYFDYWAEGIIVLKNGQQLNDVMLKYNAYEDELIINKDKSGQYYFPKSKIASFTIKEKLLGQNVNFLIYQHHKKEETYQYYRILFQGKINLIEYTKVVFEKADYDGGYSIDKRYDEFKKYAILYCHQNNLQPKKLKFTTNSIIKIFPDHQSDIKKYIAENNFNLKNENDLIQVFNFYQSIQ